MRLTYVSQKNPTTVVCRYFFDTSPRCYRCLLGWLHSTELFRDLLSDGAVARLAPQFAIRNFISMRGATSIYNGVSRRS